MKDYYLLQSKILWNSNDIDTWRYDGTMWEHKNKYNGHSIYWLSDPDDTNKFTLIATRDSSIRETDSGYIKVGQGI